MIALIRDIDLEIFHGNAGIANELLRLVKVTEQSNLANGTNMCRHHRMIASLSPGQRGSGGDFVF